MNHSELINKFSRLYPNLDKKTIKSMTGLIWDYCSESLKNSKRIEIKSFGIFVVNNRKHSNCFNNISKPYSGKTIKVINVAICISD